MQRPSKDVVKWIVMATLPVWVIPLGWTLAFSSWILVSWAGMFLANFELISVFGLFAALVTFVVAPFGLLFRTHRHNSAFALLVAVLFTASFIAGAAVGVKWVWRPSIERIAERGVPLVNAINAFVAANGRPPQTLEELVPKFLPAIPGTGLGKHPDFQYIVGQPNSYDGNDWVLIVHPPCVTMGFDVFMYFPKQNYPKSGYGGGIERIGGWGYVHE